MKVTAILSNGSFKVHKTGCSDVTKLVKKGRVSEAELNRFETDTQTEAITDLWSDILAETEPADLPGQWTGCVESTTFLACTKGLEVGDGLATAIATAAHDGEPKFEVEDAEAPTDESSSQSTDGDTTDPAYAQAGVELPAKWSVFAYGANMQPLFFAHRGERLPVLHFSTDEQVSAFVAKNLVSAWAPAVGDHGVEAWARRAVKSLHVVAVDTGDVVQTVEPQAVKASRRVEVTPAG